MAICTECKQDKELNVLNLCEDCFKLKECFYYEDLLKQRDRIKQERLLDLQEIAELLIECECPLYIDNKSFSNRIIKIIDSLKELDRIKDNTSND